MKAMKTVKWGILGCGNIANKFAEALQKVDNSELSAVAARDEGRAKGFAEKWHFQKAYGSYRKLTDDPEVDIIYIATPHSYHFAHTKLCLEAGKHVICEKPFTINTAQLEVLIRLARQKNLLLQEALWSKYLPGIIKTKELIEQKVIGEIIYMDADFGINRPYGPEHRLYNPLLAGGTLLDIGIYPLFMALYLFGEPEIIKAHSILNSDKIDLTTSLITESKNGIVSHLSSTTQADTPVKIHIYGRQGNIEFSNMWFTPGDIIVRADKQEEEVLKFPPIENGYEYEAIDAVKNLLSGRTESAIVDHNFSLLLMQKLDEIRKITGIIYPDSIESVDQPYGWNEI